jgi:hypothetical protein
MNRRASKGGVSVKRGWLVVESFADFALSASLADSLPHSLVDEDAGRHAEVERVG